MIESYSSIYTLGHRYLADLFNGPVVIQEKIDGSQFSFGVIDGKLQCRSRGQEIHVDAPEKMFAAAVATARRIFESGKMVSGATYRCEYLQKQKHNVLGYSRVPTGHLMLFDVQLPGQLFCCSEHIRAAAETHGIEAVPVLAEGVVGAFNGPDVEKFLAQESVLGGCKIEGVVVKNYNQFGPDKKILIGKFVSPAFKEVHRHEWRKENPTKSDIVQSIIADYKTSLRWHKGRQHLAERGELQFGPEDIGKLIKEIQVDVMKEEYEVIRDRLFNHFWPQISRGIVAGAAEWYKQLLFNETNPPNKE